jgi:integrator complex subunit 9
MKVAHCAIDTSLNFTQANKLIRDLKPSTLVVPECYTQPPVSAPNLTDYVIENSPDRTLIPYKWGEVINLPLKRKHGQVFIETGVAQKIVPVEVKPGVSLSTITGTLNVKDNVHSIQVRGRNCTKSKMYFLIFFNRNYHPPSTRLINTLSTSGGV